MAFYVLKAYTTQNFFSSNTHIVMELLMLQSFVMRAIWGGDDNLAGSSHGPRN